MTDIIIALSLDAILLRDRLRPVSEADMLAVAASFAERGQDQPIIVRDAGDRGDKMRLVAGAHRVTAARYLGWKACHAMDAQAPGALEAALHSKIFGSEAAVRVITNLMSVVGIDSYDHQLPLGGLLQDALVLPLFDGGNMGVRRRQLHELLMSADYHALDAAGAA